MRHIPQTDRKTLPAPEGFGGLRIAFFSDVHLCRFFSGAEFEPAIRMIAEERPDLILLGGDYAESLDMQKEFFRLAGTLKAPLGLYGVLGNNDRECFRSLSPMQRMAAKAGIRLLINEETTLRYNNRTITIAGLDESKHGSPNAAKLMRDTGDDDLRILLSHYPKGVNLTRRAGGRPHIALCGHTHGGQIKVLGRTCYDLGYGKNKIEMANKAYISGWYDVRGTQMLVSNGIGESLMPLRIGCPRQIHMITLE